MTKFTALLGAAFISLTASNAFAADVTIVKFQSNDCSTCAIVDSQLNSAIAMAGTDKVEAITIDSSNGLKWEVSAHTAFDNNVVPQFNKWVGLTGFAAVVDTKTQRTLGCISDKTDVYKAANLIKKSAGLPYDRAVSNRSSEFVCPPTYNVDPGE
jgi:hypothetical protein